MNTIKYERRLLYLVYILCIGLFTNLALLKTPVDKMAFVMAAVIIVVIGFSHYIIRKFYPNGDKYIFILASVLAVIGMAILYSMSITTAVKQLVWFCVGITAYMLIVIILPDFKRLAKYKNIYMIATIAFMSMAEIFGTNINGSKNWIRFGSFTFQPSEIGKLTLILYLAAVLINYKPKKGFINDLKQLVEPGIIVALSIGFMVLQSDLGAALLFFILSLSILYVATSNKKYVAIALVLFILGATFAALVIPHVRERFIIWLNVWKYAQTKSYQIVQGFYSISAGGAFGQGLGQGITAYIPFVDTDFIYSAVCQEYGMIFSIAMLFLYFLIFYRGMRAAISTKDKFSRLCAVGFSTLIVVQVLVIIGGIFAVIPLTGITLPLISYGGTSMLTIFFALGSLQKISEEGIE
ncbi:MAG: FtsW/RodA/SpoVE family cell cycle protein [Sarcina sp.]